MFLNSDSIKKRVISFENESDYFKDDEQIIRFEDIISYYHQETAQFTNSVYEGTELKFTLYLKNQTKPYIIKIDSNKKEKYSKIYNLSYTISSFRARNILKELEEKRVVEFMTLNDFKLLLSKENSLKVEYLDNKNHYEPFVVYKVKPKITIYLLLQTNQSHNSFLISFFSYFLFHLIFYFLIIPFSHKPKNR
jgi:hypothetical protein